MRAHDVGLDYTGLGRFGIPQYNNVLGLFIWEIKKGIYETRQIWLGQHILANKLFLNVNSQNSFLQNIVRFQRTKEKYENCYHTAEN